MAQISSPASDQSVGGWTTNANANTNLYQAIDESAFSDADFVQSDPTSNADTYVVNLAPVTDPGSNSQHTLSYRYKKDASVGETIDLDVVLAAGSDTWPIHTNSHDALSQTIAAGSFTLTSAEVDEFRAKGGYAVPRVMLSRRKRQTITTSTGVTYTTSPTTLVCDIRRPSTGGPYPVVICVVDGGWTQNTFTTAEAEAIRFAEEEGFVAVTIGLRTPPTDIAPAPMEDCADMIDFLVANAATYNADPTRIAAIGGSGGGHVAMFMSFGTYLTADQFARVKCTVGASPPCDLRTMDDDGAAPSAASITQFLGVSEAASPSTWEFFSPTYRVAADTKPILLVYSTGDSIPPAQGNRLAAVLAANGIDHRMLTYAGTEHGWAEIDNPLAWAEIVTWLHRYLG